MKKTSLILLCLFMVGLGSACSKAPATAAASVQASVPAEIVAPKPAVPGPGSAAPELTAEQIAKIQAEIAARAPIVTK
ncbi:MAG: hypothetical protein Q7U16_12490 [Agitococcus sp.]|nr:hypothetical protein [Agitococcus sp.]